jgi:serine/threonine-protein phosphatase CPPED1
MRQLILCGMVLTVLGTAAALSLTETNPGQEQTPNPAIQVSVEQVNPWTRLDVNREPRQFRFAIVADRTGGHRPGIFESAVEKLNMLQPEFVMSVGDLIEGGTTDPAVWKAEWAEFEGMVDKLDMPFFYCPGNHDISNLPMSAEWKRKFGRDYYSFRYRDVFFLVLNTEDPPGKEPPYQIGTAQQRWAIEQLNNHRDARWTFLFLHKPTWTYTEKEQDPAKLGWLSIEDVLEGRSYTVFAGHKHRYAKFQRRGMNYYMLATTGGSTKLEEGLENGRFDHFVWVTMKADGPVIANILVDGVLPEDVSTLPEK